jgi:hypothetical protein
MTEEVQRFPNGDRKYLSHIELEKQGWRRGDYRDRPCKNCGAMGEWWGRPGQEDWTFFNKHTTQAHSCNPR